MTEVNDIINTVICGDCLPILRSLPDRCIKLVFADPPYNFGVKYGICQDNLPRDEYIAWCKEWFTEIRRISDRTIITPGHGNMWMWGAEIEKPFGTGCWYKPGNVASSMLGWCCWEPWLYYTNDKKILGGPDSFRITVTKQQDTGDHPCPKPLTLLRELIKKTTKEDDIVLDPFSGSGTTLLAAKILKRKYIGFDLEPRFVEHSQRRLNAMIDIFE